MFGIVPHPVTKDPFVVGDVVESLLMWKGTISATMDGTGVVTVKCWKLETPAGDDPDFTATSDNLDEAMRFLLGSAWFSVVE